jgi:hypothetical protein
MRPALIILALLFANSATAEWVNLWEERERLIAECAGSAGGSPACKKLVPVLREIGLLDDALAAQEKVLAAEPSVDAQLLLVELQIEQGSDGVAIARIKALAESATLSGAQSLRVAKFARRLGDWPLAATVLKQTKITDAKLRYGVATMWIEFDDWDAARVLLADAKIGASEDLIRVHRVLGEFGAGLLGGRFEELKSAADAELACWILHLQVEAQFGQPHGKSLSTLWVVDRAAGFEELERRQAAAPEDATLAHYWLGLGGMKEPGERLRRAVALAPEASIAALFDWNSDETLRTILDLIADKLPFEHAEHATRLAVEDGRLDLAKQFLRRHSLRPALPWDESMMGRLSSPQRSLLATCYAAFLSADRDAELLADIRAWYEAAAPEQRCSAGSILLLALHFASRGDEVERLSAELAATCPNDANLLVFRTRQAMQTGDGELARELWRRIADRFPKQREHCRYQRYLCWRGAPVELAEIAAEVVAESWNPEHLHSIADLLHSDGLDELALPVAKAAARLTRGRNENLATLLVELGKPGVAETLCPVVNHQAGRDDRIQGLALARPEDFLAQLADARRLETIEAMTQAIQLRQGAWRLRAERAGKLAGDAEYSQAAAEFATLLRQNRHAGFLSLWHARAAANQDIRPQDRHIIDEALGEAESEDDSYVSTPPMPGDAFYRQLRILHLRAAEGESEATIRRLLRTYARLGLDAGIDPIELYAEFGFRDLVREEGLRRLQSISAGYEWGQVLSQLGFELLPPDLKLPDEALWAWSEGSDARVARKHLQELIRRHPQDSKPRIALAKLASHRREHVEALRIWQELLRADSANPAHRDGYVDALHGAERLDEARKQAAAFAVDGNVQDLVREANYLRLLEQPAEAAERYRAALKADPVAADAAIGLAETLEELDDPDGAITILRETLAQPGCVGRQELRTALRNRELRKPPAPSSYDDARWLARLGRHAEAGDIHAADFARLGHANLATNAARQYWLAGDKAKAGQMCDLAVAGKADLGWLADLFPQRVIAAANAALRGLDEGLPIDFPTAQWENPYTKAFPLRVARGKALLQLGRYREASRDFLWALEREHWERIGPGLLKACALGDLWDEMYTACLTRLQEHPRRYGTRVWHAVLCYQLGRKRELVEATRFLSHMDPQYGFWSLGQAIVQADDAERIPELLERVRRSPFLGDVILQDSFQLLKLRGDLDTALAITIDHLQEAPRASASGNYWASCLAGLEAMLDLPDAAETIATTLSPYHDLLRGEPAYHALLAQGDGGQEEPEPSFDGAIMVEAKAALSLSEKLAILPLSDGGTGIGVREVYTYWPPRLSDEAVFEVDLPVDGAYEVVLRAVEQAGALNSVAAFVDDRRVSSPNGDIVAKRVYHLRAGRHRIRLEFDGRATWIDAVGFMPVDTE